LQDFPNEVLNFVVVPLRLASITNQEFQSFVCAPRSSFLSPLFMMTSSIWCHISSQHPPTYSLEVEVICSY